MVLSNRKLKQHLREKIADSQLTFEIVKSDPDLDPNPLPQSFRELLGSKTPKPSLSKRAKRRKLAALRAPPASGSGGNNEQNNGQKEEKSGDLGLEGNVDLNKEIGSKKFGAEKKSEALGFEENSENGSESLGKKKKKKRKRDEEVKSEALGFEEKSENGLVSLGKKKKRKRDEEVKSGDENVKEEARKPKKKKPKWKKKKEAKNGEEDKKGFEIVSEGKKGIEIVSQVQSVNVSPMETEREVNVEVTTKVYVGGIPYYSTEDDIRSYFESCGSITEIDCMTFPDSGKFKGIAIISFRTEAAAKRALALDGADMGGLFLKILPYKATRVNKVSDFAPKIVEGYNRIYVGNLSWDITEDKLKELFSDCKISSINFGLDKETGEFKGYAHVEFSDSLSLTMALKLDQKVVLGRPVKISCAVPLRKPGIQPKSLSTTTGIVLRTVATDVSEEADNTGLSSGKLKRRTCYECGEKGHVSSLCPKKQPADVTDTKPTFTKPVMTKSTFMDYVTTSTHLDSATTESADAGLSSLSGKIKRRTCYECGEKGHVSTACPKKQSAAVMTHTNAYTTPVHTVTNPILESAAITSTAGVDNTGISSVGGKTKKRTCYECGEKGHVSTACPWKQSAHPTKTAPTHKPPVQTPTPAMDSTATTTFTGAEPDNAGLSSISGKVKRRTCYECGEKGHISSACPKKQSVDNNAS